MDIEYTPDVAHRAHVLVRLLTEPSFLEELHPLDIYTLVCAYFYKENSKECIHVFFENLINNEHERLLTLLENNWQILKTLFLLNIPGLSKLFGKIERSLQIQICNEYLTTIAQSPQIMTRLPLFSFLGDPIKTDPADEPLAVKLMRRLVNNQQWWPLLDSLLNNPHFQRANTIDLLLCLVKPEFNINSGPTNLLTRILESHKKVTSPSICNAVKLLSSLDSATIPTLCEAILPYERDFKSNNQYQEFQFKQDDVPPMLRPLAAIIQNSKFFFCKNKLIVETNYLIGFWIDLFAAALDTPTKQDLFSEALQFLFKILNLHHQAFCLDFIMNNKQRLKDTVRFFQQIVPHRDYGPLFNSQNSEGGPLIFFENIWQFAHLASLNPAKLSFNSLLLDYLGDYSLEDLLLLDYPVSGFKYMLTLIEQKLVNNVFEDIQHFLIYGANASNSFSKNTFINQFIVLFAFEPEQFFPLVNQINTILKEQKVTFWNNIGNSTFLTSNDIKNPLFIHLLLSSLNLHRKYNPIDDKFEELEKPLDPLEAFWKLEPVLHWILDMRADIDGLKKLIAGNPTFQKLPYFENILSIFDRTARQQKRCEPSKNEESFQPYTNSLRFLRTKSASSERSSSKESKQKACP